MLGNIKRKKKIKNSCDSEWTFFGGKNSNEFLQSIQKLKTFAFVPIGDKHNKNFALLWLIILIT